MSIRFYSSVARTGQNHKHGAAPPHEAVESFTTPTRKWHTSPRTVSIETTTSVSPKLITVNIFNSFRHVSVSTLPSLHSTPPILFPPNLSTLNFTRKYYMPTNTLSKIFSPSKLNLFLFLLLSLVQIFFLPVYQRNTDLLFL